MSRPPPDVPPQPPPGAGSPVQPGPPLSVQEPIRDTSFNLGAAALLVGVAIVAIIVVVLVVVIVGAALASHR